MKTKRLTVNTMDVRSHINREIYGHFSEHLGRCIYRGIFVGKDSEIPNTDGVRNDIIEAFKQIRMPVLRWPGGCFADEYHWRDGIGKPEERSKMINTHWGGVTEDNSFGTNEFLNFCEAVGCEPYISGNIGSGTVEELADWVEYMTSDSISPMTDLRKKNGREKPWKVKYLGLGNEAWGCGGNMRPEFYANEYRRYQTYCRNFSGNQLYKIACGPYGDDLNWTDKLLDTLNGGYCNAISIHYYTFPTQTGDQRPKATVFTDSEYYDTIRIARHVDDVIRRQQAVMLRYSPDIKMSIDEWGTWYAVEEGTNPGFLYQQNTMRDAIVAACSLHIFNSHSDVVAMANLAQTVNVLQAIILTEGPALVKTPTYHVFDLLKEHQGAELVYSHVENDEINGIPALSQSASIKDGKLILTIANCSLEEDYTLDCSLLGFEPKSVTGRILHNDVRAYNDFDHANDVEPEALSADIIDGGLRVVIPRCSVASLEIE